MKIDPKDITIHHISSERNKGLLYWYKDKLYRSPSTIYAPILAKASKLPHVQRTELTEHTFTFKSQEVPVYEHNIYPHRTRIQEMPSTKKKEFVEVLCDLNIEATKQGIICRDIHEGNINYTIDGIRYIDMTGFDLAHDDVCQYTFDAINYLTTTYLKTNIDNWKNKDYKTTQAWIELKDFVSQIDTGPLEASGWFTGYSHNMDIYNPINDKAIAIWEMFDHVDGDVETVTDVGSNKGYYACMAARRFKSVIGFEIDESCVDFAIDLNNNKFKVPAVFGQTTIQNLIADKLFEHDRFKSDMIMAFAVVHHLNRMGNSVTHEAFGKMLMKYSKKYIMLEEIDEEHSKVYHGLFTSNGYEVVDTRRHGPGGRQTVLYRKL